MNLSTLPCLTALLVAAGCSHPSSVSASSTSKGKPTAPVAVTAELSARAAHLTLRFESPAEQVQVGVSGVDGLVVSGPAVLLGEGHVAQGETRTFDVAFDPGPGRSQLVVTVSGNFRGATRARVVSFAVGSGELPASPGEVMTTGDGERVKVMPAAPK